MSQEYDIRESVKSLGKLVPVLKDKFGNVIDGLHRLEMYPDWPCVTVESIDSPAKLEAAKLAVNMNRRVVLSSEIDLRVSLLAKSGLKPEEIVSMTGLSKTTVYKHYPQGLKQEVKVAAGVASGVVRSSVPQAEQTVTIPETAQAIRTVPTRDLVSCGQCLHPTHFSKLKKLDGKDLCPLCYSQHYHVPKAETRSPEKPVESWEHRVGTMKVQHSQQETDLLKELSILGITPQTDDPICLWVTIPDGKYSDKKVCYYVHGPPHDKGKAVDKDDEIEAALKQQGWDVLVFRHGTGTVKEWAQEVKEALKF